MHNPLLDKVTVAQGVQLPAWLDTLGVMSLFNTEPITFNGLTSTVTEMLPADPQRWLIVLTNGIGVDEIQAGPDPDLATMPLIRLQSGTSERFTLFEWGPIVSRQWFIRSSLASNARVWTSTFRG